MTNLSRSSSLASIRNPLPVIVAFDAAHFIEANNVPGGVKLDDGEKHGIFLRSQAVPHPAVDDIARCGQHRHLIRENESRSAAGIDMQAQDARSLHRIRATTVVAKRVARS